MRVCYDFGLNLKNIMGMGSQELADPKESKGTTMVNNLLIRSAISCGKFKLTPNLAGWFESTNHPKCDEVFC